MRHNLAVPTFLAAVCLSAPVASLAQYEDGSVVGTVRDGSGASIPDAKVTVTNRATGVVSTRQSDNNGNYEVPALRVGQYDLRIQKEGFAPASATNITVSVAARQRVDLSLSVGATSTTVEVSDVALKVETDESERGQTITQQQTASLPLVSRNFSDLVGLAPGVRATANGIGTTSNTGLVREGSFNVNGQRSMFNNYLLDGMDNNAYGESNQGFSNEIIQTPPDSVAAFQVVTNNESAEYGRGSGATINVASAQGGNTLHGRVYEFIRNTDLNAIGFFNPPGGRKPQFNRNQFGGNVNGPIVRDHIFYFLDYEGIRQVRKQVSSATLPTPNQLAGKFSKTVYDPYNGTAYAAGTSILASPDISPIAKIIAGDIAALPNLGSTTVNNFTTLQRSNNRGDKGDLRLDFNFNQRNSMFVRASQLKVNALDAPIFGLPLDGNSNGNQRILDQQLAVGYTRVIGANQLIDVRVGISKTKAGKFSTSIGTNPGFTINGLPTDPAVAGGIPGIGITGFAALGRQTTNPQFQNPALLDPKVNYTLVRGSHSLKFGYEYQKVWMDVQDTNPLYGGFTFGGGFSRNYVGGKTAETATSDNYFADFLFGAESIYSLSSYFLAKLRTTSNFAYVQDDWKVSPTLTLNLGVRYEYASPYSEAQNRLTNFSPALALSGSTNPFTPASDSNKYGFSPDKNDFAPRVGFAYSPDGKTSLRGGFGISFAHYDRPGSGNVLAINPPNALFTNTTQTAPSAGGNPATFQRLDRGIPSGTLAFIPATANPVYIDGNRYRDSYVESYYMSVQRQLAKNSLVDIAYVGNHGAKLLQLLNYNQKDPLNGFARPIPGYGDITWAVREAYSHYDSIQVKYEQQMRAGLTLLNSFTYGHALDNAGASLESATPSPQDIRNLRGDYGNSDYNQPLFNTTSLVYDLPVGRGRRFLNSNGFVDEVLGQWQIAAINQAESGFQFNLTDTPAAGIQVAASSLPTYRGGTIYRPNRIAAGALTTLDKSRSTGTSLQYVNNSVLGIPAQAPFGNLARNAGRSPSINFLNLALNKRFATPVEHLNVEFRGELYNVFNHTNFAIPGTGFASNASGVITGGALSSTLDPRIVQFGIKVLF